MYNRKIETECNREFLKAFHESTIGFIISGEPTDITAPNKNLQMCKNIHLMDIEITPQYTKIWRVGETIEHAYIPSEIIKHINDSEFAAYAQVTRYQRDDGSFSYGFSKLPKILELELELKAAISESRKSSNITNRAKNCLYIMGLVDEMNKTAEENKSKSGFDQLSNLRVDVELIDIAYATVKILAKSLEKKKKRKGIKRDKSKGFGAFSYL